jgi:hypothetical protein
VGVRGRPPVFVFKTYMEKPELFVREQMAYFNVSSGKGDVLFAGISNTK